MEKELDKVIEEIMSTPNVSGCLVGDHQGLCLASKGNVHVDSAGIIVAISEQACKIQPNLKPPTVCLETDNKQCLIQRHGTITGALFKQKAWRVICYLFCATFNTLQRFHFSRKPAILLLDC